MPTSRRFIPAPAERVYAALVDAPSYPKWLVGAKAVLKVDPTWPTPGSGFRHEVGGGPLRTRDRTTVRSLDPGRALGLRVRARPFLEADVHFEITPSGAETAELTLSEQPRGPFRMLTGLVGPLLKARNDRSLDRFADVVGTAFDDR